MFALYVAGNLCAGHQHCHILESVIVFLVMSATAIYTLMHTSGDKYSINDGTVSG